MEDTQSIRDRIRFESERNRPPENFPKFPDLPGKRYTDPRFFELENQHLWRKTWLFAGHLDEIPKPGCFKRWEIAGQPVVILHGQDGQVRAFYNTCRHRGAPLVRSDYGTAKHLTCGYHGWTYNHKGEMVGLRDRRDFVDLDFSCRSLYPVRLERLGKFLFANFDLEARPLLEGLASLLPQWEEFRFDTLRYVHKDTFHIDCNWKIAMESNMEVYHVRSIHPETVSPMLDYRGNMNTLYPGGHARMISPLKAQNHTETAEIEDDRPDIESVGEVPRTCVLSFNLVPNLVSPMNEKGLPIFAFWPTSINTTTLELWWFGEDWGEGPKPSSWDPYIEYFNFIVDEDVQFGSGIQKAVESYAYGGVPLSYQEARLYYWHQCVDSIIGVDRIPKELRVNPVIGPEWIAQP